MKIWIDITNSPHANFFAGLISELKSEHEFILTSRTHSNTVELLELFGFSYYLFGGHPGKNIIKKINFFIARVVRLIFFLRKQKVDVAISHSAFCSPLVSKALGIRVIYLNDNEHAIGNMISFLFADRIMVPEALDRDKVRKQWAREDKIVQYPGVKEGIYLWNYRPAPPESLKIENPDRKKLIFIRPEPWSAQYYRGEKNFLDSILLELQDRFVIVLLPRDAQQAEYYGQDRFSRVVIPEKTVSLAEIMGVCDLFIGAGGTMTREAAVLGIPTISIYQDELLDVDNYLIDKGCMVHQQRLTAGFVLDYMDHVAKHPPDKKLLEKGREAYELIKEELLER